jgi:putative membrane protein
MASTAAVAQTGSQTPPDGPTVRAAPATSPDTSMPSSKGSRSNLQKADTAFLENAAQGGFAEVEAGKMAQTKASNAEVKAFGQMLIDEHTKVNQELATLASSKGYTPPTEPSVVQRTELRALGVLDGDNFDKMFMRRIGVASHEATIKQFREASRSARDPQVKAFAAKTLPSLEHHLKMAKTLQTKLGKD